MRNERTPRTLAETSFTTGYQAAELRKSGARADAVIAIIAAAVGLGWLLHAAVVQLV